VRTYTKDELLEAYAQMEREREQEATLAEQAAAWLGARCGLNVGAVSPPPYATSGMRQDVPYLPEHWLAIQYCEYDDFNDWLKARLVRPPERPGISRDEAGFWLELGPSEGFPAGTRFYCFTDWYDSHAGECTT
jgi:hypothetical protein